MLQRQRALRKQQQQTKQQSAKQLPPKGQSSADSRQARGQRTTTAKAQAANQQRVIARGMEGFIRRGKAQDKLDAAAKGTQGTGTRTAGAGGGLAKRQSSAVSQRTSGKPATQGGRVTPSASGQTSSNRVQQVRVRDLGTTKPNAMSGSGSRALPPGRAGGGLARVGSAAAAAAKNLPKAAKFASGLKGGLISAALYEGGSRAIEAGVGAYKNAIRTERGQQAASSGQSGRYVPGNQQSRGGMGGVSNIPPGEGPRNNPNYGKPSSKPKPASTQSGGGSTQSRSGSGGSSRPAAPAPRRQPGTAADAGMKNQNKDYRGNLFEKTFGYKPGQAPDQQKARFNSVDNKFGQDSGYESKTKVDGSKYADKKPDMKKVKEYDRLRRKYYD
jgi:hypothetical protein